MLNRWGTFIQHRPKLVLTLSGLGLLVAILLMATASPNLISGGFVDKNAESSQVEQILLDEFGRGAESLVFVFDADGPIDTPANRASVADSVAPLSSDPDVAQVITPWSGGGDALFSFDGRSAMAIAVLNVDQEGVEEVLPRLRAEVEESAALHNLSVSITGNGAIGEAISHEVEAGILRAESVAVPLTLLIMVLIFGSVVAAGLPLIVGGLAMVSAIAAILALSAFTDQSVFAINIISLLGLALGIDYSLFLVARYREELAKGSGDRALPNTLATVGRAILFSGITVIFGLAATWFFPMPALRSMGLAGMLVVAAALFYGLTFLPAMLALLGSRVNRFAVPIPSRLRGDGEGSFWHGVATAVMRRPLAVLAPVLVALVVAGLPFLRLELSPGGPAELPADVPARITWERVQSEFPAGESDPIPVILTVDAPEATSDTGLAEVAAFVERAQALPGVVHVTSVLSNPDQQESLIRGNKTIVEIVAESADTNVRQDLVRDLRSIEVRGASVKVGGSAAMSVDTLDGIRDGVVPAFLFVVIGSYLILLLTFGSVFLPIKAIFMTLLSISASLGALVLVFQDGRLETLLGFTSTGDIISTTPILMFCILFGLSMDYEVLMLSRIQEEYQRTGNNTASVAFGLEKTAKVITGAAAIMIVAFGAFMLADITIIKSMGFGLALAVLIDATIVRALLVPATMRLMGDLNWWAPRPVKALVDRLGFAHVEPVPSGTGD
ncbi:MAG: MMPL family transporter [Thermomicrobiales bacterium]|jgi:RND superfamily putative drug exporter|nr:MMPL family transporter [Thermomicrobiales bacterium]